MSEITTTIKSSKMNEASNQLSSTLHQVNRTMVFEIKRNVKKFCLTLIVNTIFVGLFYLINYLQDNPPEKAVDYITSYLSMISFLIMIIAITFGSSMIVEDFEKHTGNLLFPKIERGRLLIGRYVARYFYASLSLCVYYLEVIFITSLNYDSLPVEMWQSLGWAILYLNLVLSFVVLMSALLNRVATATIMSLLFILMGFQIISTILTFTESTVEPLFVLTYYSNIITQCFDMPETRFMESNPINRGPEGVTVNVDRVFRSWSTPSVEGALIGMLIYSGILLLCAYLLYQRKQAKD